MNNLVPKAGVTVASLHNQDFLETNPNDEELSLAEYILVDPSCSGTGMVGRMDYLTDGDDGPSQERLMALAKVQLKLLNHALSFPNAKQVVYSTCSVHAEENEEVVKKALEENPDFELKRVLPPWGQNAVVNRNVGEEDPEISRINSLCLHSLPNEHLTNGFFVSLFEKKNVKFDIMAQKGMKRQFEDDDEEEEEEEKQPPKKQKKKKKKQSLGELAADIPQNGSHHGETQGDSEQVEPEQSSRSGKKKTHKKKVKQELDEDDQEGSGDHDQTVSETPSKTKSPKKKKKKSRKSLDENM